MQIIGEIRNSFNKGIVEAHSDAVGGICGINHNSISNCYNLKHITTSTNSIGGIAGYGANEGSISNCINSGDIKGGGSYIGGIIGYGNKTNIINCKSNCTLSGQNDIGGIVGNSVDVTKVSNCKWYANSEVSFGIGSLSSNKNATYVENLQLESVLDIVNGENNFKSNGVEVVLNWQ